jgi:hypothetical protein
MKGDLMSEVNIVRGALVIYGILAFLTLFLMWNNASATDAIKNAGIMCASLLPILIVVLPYLISEKMFAQYTYALFYDSQQKEIISGDSDNPYASNYMLAFSNLSKEKDNLKAQTLEDFAYRKGFDIIEKGIIESLSLYFGKDWNIIINESEGPSGKALTIGSADGSAKTSLILETNQLKEMFQHNKLIVNDVILPTPKIALPQDSKMTTTQKEQYLRFIKIKNRFSEVNIEIFANMGVVAQQGIWGIFKADPTNMNRFYSQHYVVKLTMETARLKRYSPEMEGYRKWFLNLSKVLSEYDWDKVNKKVESTELRKTISNSWGTK